MSGIAGLIRFDGGAFESGIVKSMLARMSHRGPDGISLWHAEGVSLGQCMLRTTPESLVEEQPLVDQETGNVLIMDGRVDNWDELRNELQAVGAQLRTRTDAELVLKAYQTWGKYCLDHIDGDFALAVWDAQKYSLFFARDRLGARPFYYHWDGCRFSFASELHAILNLPWVPQRLNEAMIAEKLTAEECSLTETFWVDVLRLNAAHAAVVNHGGPKLEEYWHPRLKPEIQYRRLDDYAEHYREIFLESVRRHSRSHLAVACEVSGGLDSSAVFAVADRLDRSGGLLAPNIQGYSLHFGDGSTADEIRYARIVGKRLGRNIREIPPTLETVDWYKDLVKFYCDFPHYPNTVMGHSIHKAASEHGCRVILTGYGGDEWQMGSRYYYADLIGNCDVSGVFSVLRDDIRAFGPRAAIYGALRYGIVPLLPRRGQEALRRILQRWRRRPRTAGFRLSEHLETAINIGGAKTNILRRDAAPRHEASFRTLHSAQRRTARESFNLLASAIGIEKRDPMTSTPMVEFHFRTPDAIRQRSNEFRICHRAAMREYLPAEILNRDSKAEFSSTIKPLLHDIFCCEMNAPFDCARRWLHPKEVQRILSNGDSTHIPMADLWVLWALFGCSLLAGQVRVS